jgi:hypothetical protein
MPQQRNSHTPEISSASRLLVIRPWLTFQELGYGVKRFNTIIESSPSPAAPPSAPAQWIATIFINSEPGS